MHAHSTIYDNSPDDISQKKDDCLTVVPAIMEPQWTLSGDIARSSLLQRRLVVALQN